MIVRGRREGTHHSSLITHHSIPALRTSTLLQIVLFAGIFVLSFFMDTDPDLWWHLATGRYMVETGSLPRFDPFSYTAVGQPWVAHEWLAEIPMYLLYRSGGFLVLVLLSATLITSTFWIAFRGLRSLGLGIAGASSITFWVAMMSMPGLSVRPQLFSYLFFSAYLYLLLRSRRRRDRFVWLLPPIMAVWVNLHAGYVMGLLLAGLFLLGEGINGFRSSPITHHPSLRMVAAATLAATAANPQGLSILLYPFTYAGTQNASMKYIMEWQSPNFHDYFLFVFGASMMLLMVTPNRRPFDWALALPLLALTAMSLQSIRVIPFYAIAVAQFLGSRFQHAPTHHSSLITHHSSRWNWALLGLCLAILTSTLFLSERTQVGPEPRTDDYPAAGARYIREAGLEGNLFNSYHWGGFLIWTFYPERRVFIDGRADMYGDAFVEEFRKVYDARPGWKETLDRYRVDVVLIEKDSRVATLLEATGEWEGRFQGETEAVFARLRGGR